MPKFRNMPPMSCLKAFEAVARLLSFKDAANELCVTPSAVSHQIKSLESFIGMELFIRNGKSISLSDDGKQYAFVIRQSFEMISSASKEIMLSADNDRLRIYIGEIFKIRIIDPIIDDFKKLYPCIEIDMEVISDEESLQEDIDFNDSAFDVALIWGLGAWSGADVWGLFETRISAFASPDMKNIEIIKKDLSRIKQAPWIINKQFPSAWIWWLSALGVSDIASSDDLVEAENIRDAYEKATSGDGILLVDRTLVAEDVDAGLLVEVTNKDIGSFAYYLCSSFDASNKRVVKLFRQWLLGKAKELNWPPLRGMLRQNTKGNVYSLKETLIN